MAVLNNEDRAFLGRHFERMLGLHASGAVSTDSALETSFQNMVSALGDSSSSATLTNFLSALASNLQSNGPTGNMVNTSA